MKVQLPNGLIDGVDYFNYVEIEELKGKQQNYLADKDLVVGNIGHIPRILSDLVVGLETKEGLKWKGDLHDLCWKLPATDIETILIKIREETFGADFYHQAICEHCEHINTSMKLKLNNLELSPIKFKDMTDIKKRSIKLPKCKKNVELKPLFLRDLFEVIKTTQSRTDKLITSLSLLSVKTLGEKTPVSENDLAELSAMDIAFLSKAVEGLNSDNKNNKLKLEGSIDTLIEFDCAKCHKEASIKLNVFDPDFFDHSKATPI